MASQPPSQDHGAAAFLKQPSVVFGKKPQSRRQDAAKEGQPHDSSMYMAGEDKIRPPFGIRGKIVRIMGDQNVVLSRGRLPEQPFQIGRVHSAFLHLLIKLFSDLHSIQTDSGLRKQQAFIFKENDAAALQLRMITPIAAPVVLFIRLHPVFMVSVGIINGIFFRQSLCQLQSRPKPFRSLRSEHISGNQNALRLLRVDSGKQLFMMRSVTLVMQIGEHDKPIFPFQVPAADMILHRNETVGIISNRPDKDDRRRTENADEKINHVSTPLP